MWEASRTKAQTGEKPKCCCKETASLAVYDHPWHGLFMIFTQLLPSWPMTYDKLSLHRIGNYGFCFVLFFLPELRTKPRALHLLGKYSMTELNPQPWELRFLNEVVKCKPFTMTYKALNDLPLGGARDITFHFPFCPLSSGCHLLLARSVLQTSWT